MLRLRKSDKRRTAVAKSMRCHYVKRASLLVCCAGHTAPGDSVSAPSAAVSSMVGLLRGGGSVHCKGNQSLAMPASPQPLVPWIHCWRPAAKDC